jgi:hypothetical protein
MTFTTLKSKDVIITLSFIALFLIKNSTFLPICLKIPPTMAAKWITWVGLYFSNILTVASLLLYRNQNKKVEIDIFNQKLRTWNRSGR